MNSYSDPYPRGTVDFVSATVTADVELDGQPVEISLGRPYVWLPAEWEGTAAETRVARTVEVVEFGDDYPAAAYVVYVRVTDSPEVPIMRAGTITID